MIPDIVKDKMPFTVKDLMKEMGTSFQETEACLRYLEYCGFLIRQETNGRSYYVRTDKPKEDLPKD